MKHWALALPALLAACGAVVDCLPAASSPERERFRAQLRGLVHYMPCPGLPTPKDLAAREPSLFDREQAFLERVRSSRLKPDLDQARREDEEWSRNVFEADCAMYSEESAETPKGRKMYLDQLRADEEALRAAEHAFVAITAKCDATKENG